MTVPTLPTVPAHSGAAGRFLDDRSLRRWLIGPVACVAASGVLLGCEAPLVPALPAEDVYEYQLALDPPETLRWPVGSTVRVHTVEGGPDPALLRAAAAAGAAAWNAHALLDEYRVELVARPSDADVLIAWSGVPLPVETSACPPSAGRAQTTFCLDGQRLFAYPSSTGQSSDVKMLVTIGTVLANASSSELHAVLAHELGHVLGLVRHSEVATDLMYTDPTRTTPSQRDVATVRALYRAPVDIVP